MLSPTLHLAPSLPPATKSAFTGVVSLPPSQLPTATSYPRVVCIPLQKGQNIPKHSQKNPEKKV